LYAGASWWLRAIGWLLMLATMHARLLANKVALWREDLRCDAILSSKFSASNFYYLEFFFLVY
jgi:hypothetical protein